MNVPFPISYAQTPSIVISSDTSSRVVSYTFLDEKSFTPHYQKFSESFYGGNGYYIAIGY